MEHHFDIEIAEKYGILEAVLLDHFMFWDTKNEANESNYHDGLYWTYNSTKAMAKLFPYASIGQIRRALKKLEAEGLIVTGNYNKSTYDRTTWYALTKNGKCICQNCKMEVSDLQNGIAENDKPIPYTITDTETDTENIYSQIVKAYNEICISLPKCIKLTDKRKKKIEARLKDNSYEDIITAFTKAEQSDFLSGRNGKWQACNFEWFFEKPDTILNVLEGKYDQKKSYNSVELKFEKALDNIRSGENGNGSYFD